MRKIVLLWMGVWVCSSITLGAFDYNVSEVYYDFTLELNDQSVLVEGAGVKEITANGSSYVEVGNTLPLQPHFGGIGRVNLRDTSSMSLYGGEVDIVDLLSSTAVIISGGSIAGSVISSSNSIVNVSGGYVERLYVNGHSAVTLTGGDINIITVGFNVSDDASFMFVCNLDSLNYSYDEGLLVGVTGNWLDGSIFDVEIQNLGYNPTSEYISFVPEPATLILFSLGGLAVRRLGKRKQLK